MRRSLSRNGTRLQDTREPATNRIYVQTKLWLPLFLAISRPGKSLQGFLGWTRAGYIVELAELLVLIQHSLLFGNRLRCLHRHPNPSPTSERGVLNWILVQSTEYFSERLNVDDHHAFGFEVVIQSFRTVLAADAA